MKKAIDRIFEVVNWVSTISLMIMVVLVFLNVVLRYLFDSGLPWSEEASRIAFVWVVFLGIVIANRDDSHLRVDVVASKLHGLPKKITKITQGLITLLVLISVLIGGIKLMMLTHAQALPATGLPTSIIYIAGVGACLVLLVTIVLSFFSKNREEEK